MGRHTQGCAHSIGACEHPGTHKYLVAKSPLENSGQPSDRWGELGRGTEGHSREGVPGAGEWRGWAVLRTSEGTVAPVPFLGTQPLPGQLESNLSPGFCPPAKIFGANRVPCDLSDGVSWWLAGIGPWVDSVPCLPNASYTPS